MLIISDGQDNTSQATVEDVRRALKESNIVIYAIVIPPSTGMEMSIAVLAGKEMLSELARSTGGRAYTPDFPNSLRFPDENMVPRPYMSPEEAAERIALELRHQYSLAYSPTNKNRNGKWRKIKV